MTALATVLSQLVLLALTCAAALISVSAARRAASFDITHDFEQLAQTVAKLQRATRSEVMQKVRAAALEPKPQPEPAAQLTPKEQLRAAWRAKLNGGIRQ